MPASKDILIYYFYGEDSFRILKEIENIKSALLKEGQLDFNFDNLINPPVEDFLSIANSFPVLSDKRIIKIEDFENSFISDPEIFKYLMSPLSSTIVIFYDKGLKINENSKLFKELKIKNYFKLSKIRGLYDNELPSYIKNICKEKGINLSEEAIFYLVRYIGNDTSNIDNELNKISFGLLRNSKRKETGAVPNIVSLKELKPLLSFSKKFTVFDFSDKILERDLKGAFAVFGIIYEAGEEPVKLVSVLYNEIRKIHRAKIQESQGLDIQTILSVNAVLPFLKNKFLKNMSNFTIPELRTMIKLLEETDLRLKTLSFPHNLIFEDFIFKSGFLSTNKAN